ncbi:hypothetical protein FMM80_01050 [Schaedlerella arabinosiphila]|uniref:Uncharacterized protein n=1 Tax=Schaedlerella arabinosiphila TaxID=2044587 RepID=A0A9X5C3U2_9FIRM|nr:hypothetical protein [Schaedlerella arabinosiphila]NDO67395.1 hypothetical protein [Schaedlerella arabinosiphila]
MENKEKIVLKDCTQIEIENGAIENRIQTVIQNFSELEELYEKFTEENLENYIIQNASGLTCATIENKRLDDIRVKKVDTFYLVTFNLVDVDMLEKRVAMLEESQKELKESQDIQDGAIDDLGIMVSDLASVNDVDGGEN